MSEIKLPEPNLSGYRLDAPEWEVGYTADQMRAAILEERERCAKVAETVAVECYMSPSYIAQSKQQRETIAAAIRSK